MKDDLAAMKAVIGLTAEQAKETAVMESTDPKEILNSLSLDIQKTFPKLPQTSVEVKYVPKAMEAHLSPAFYMIPALDDTEENVIYVNQAQMGNKLTLYTTLPRRGIRGICIRRFITHQQNRIHCAVFSILADMWKAGQRMRKWVPTIWQIRLPESRRFCFRKTVPFCWHCMRWQIWGFIMMGGIGWIL